jgi:hypothetical protein
VHILQPHPNLSWGCSVLGSNPVVESATIVDTATGANAEMMDFVYKPLVPAFPLTNNYLLTTLNTSKWYILSFQVRPLGTINNATSSIMTFVSREGLLGDMKVTFAPGTTKLDVVGPQGAHCRTTHELPLLEWSKVEIKMHEQQFIVSVQGSPVCTVPGVDVSLDISHSVAVYATAFTGGRVANAQLKAFNYEPIHGGFAVCQHSTGSGPFIEVNARRRGGGGHVMASRAQCISSSISEETGWCATDNEAEGASLTLRMKSNAYIAGVIVKGRVTLPVTTIPGVTYF